MSKNIVLKKTNTSATINGVTRLVTPEVGGGSCGWLWEDETELGEITVTSNGTYTAADAGFYGFSVVHVEAAPPITGTTANGTYTVYFDDTGRARMTWGRST